MLTLCVRARAPSRQLGLSVGGSCDNVIVFHVVVAVLFRFALETVASHAIPARATVPHACRAKHNDIETVSVLCYCVFVCVCLLLCECTRAFVMEVPRWPPCLVCALYIIIIAQATRRTAMLIERTGEHANHEINNNMISVSRVCVCVCVS